MPLFRNIKKFYQISNLEKSILIKGIGFSLFFHFIVLFLPLKTYIKLLKSTPKKTNQKYDFNENKKLIHKSIRRIDKVVLWNCTCLNKVLTAKYLYKLVGINSEINLVLINNSFGGRCAHASLLVDNCFEYLAIEVSSKLVKI